MLYVSPDGPAAEWAEVLLSWDWNSSKEGVVKSDCWSRAIWERGSWNLERGLDMASQMIRRREGGIWVEA